MMQTMLMLMVFVLGFTGDPARPQGAVTKALFKLEKGEGFLPPRSNAELQALLAEKPKLDPFETAALGETKELARLLAKDAGLLQARNDFGWTLLHFAAFAGHTENVALLLDRGADIHSRAKTRFRNTPLQVALLTGQYETAKLLLERGADVLDRQAGGFSPMHEAAFLGRVDLIELLLAHGAELDVRSNNGRTPLSEALRGKHAAAAELLRAKGAKEN